MKICPRCRATYSNPQEDFCTADGVHLVDFEDLEAAEGDPMLGRNVAGRFHIVAVIGVGGMGTVYKAVQSEIDRTVALKVLNKELEGSEIPVKRFRREARAASLLSSPHTVTLHEFGQDEDGTLFLAMEMLEGESLSDRIERQGALPWQDAVEIISQVNESLMEAHDNGIVHRDMKPENVFLAEGVGGKEIAKVLDFGIARLTQTEEGPEVGLTHTGMIFGTPGYMSPEQAKGQKVDGRSDMYSLGVVLYEMLAGLPPFESEEAVLLMGQHISADVPSLASRSGGVEVPPTVENLARRLLIKDPDQRIQNGRELADGIAALLSEDVDAPAAPVDVTSGAVPAVGAVPAPTERPRNRGVLIGAAVAVVLLAGATLGAALAVPGLLGGGGQQAAADNTPLPPAAPSKVDAAVGPVESMVEIIVNVTPLRAGILLDGEPVPGNPYRGLHARSDEPHRLRIVAEGYLTQDRIIQFDRERELDISLTADPAAVAVKSRPAKGRPGKGRPGKVKGGGASPKVVITKVPDRPPETKTKTKAGRPIDTVPPWEQ